MFDIFNLFAFITLQGATSPCKSTFKTEFLPLLEDSGDIPQVPGPITFQVGLDIIIYIVDLMHFK
jgi:hypothetical protein